MNKVSSLDQALERIQDGATILMGGFGVCGIPENLIRGLVKRGTKNLTIVSNNAGVEQAGIGLLINNGQVRKMISSYIGENKALEQKLISKEIEVELNPQGTLAERVRCGGAGIPAFYTPTGVGTPVAEGKETREFDGRQFLMERAIRGNVAFVKAYKADRHGNLVYRMTARNFNPVMATAADFVIAEVEEIVEPGQLSPEQIVTPSVYVDMVILGEQYEKRIEKRVYRQKSGAGV
jgi:3-oxoacid CoA-transferase subunit A